MYKTRKLLPVLCALPLAFAACGGDSDEDKIRAIIEDGAETPSTICDNASKALLDQIGGKDACVEASKQAPDSGEPDISGVKIDGDKATATVKDKDGTTTVGFVKEDGDWKVSSSN